MKASKSDRRKLKKLAPFADLYYQINALIGGLTIRQMKSLVTCCDVPDSSNCGWTTYRVAPIVREILTEEIKIKEYAAWSARNKKRKKQKINASLNLTLSSINVNPILRT